jgi:hypothetical protein
MKKAIILSAFIAAIAAHGQTNKTEYLSKTEIGGVKCQDLKITDRQGTGHYLYFGYQDNEFKTITVIKSIMFDAETQVEQLKGFRDNLVAAAGYKDNADVAWQTDDYRIQRYSFTEKVYLYNENDRYTIISKNDATKIADWIGERITLKAF